MRGFYDDLGAEIRRVDWLHTDQCPKFPFHAVEPVGQSLLGCHEGRQLTRGGGGEQIELDLRLGARRTGGNRVRQGETGSVETAATKRLRELWDR